MLKLKMDTLVWRISLAVSVLTGLSTFILADVEQLCQMDTFNASCPLNNVIIMETARYGRMRLGRCLSADYYIGCFADVITHLDDRCSGRQHCVIKLPDTDLFNIQPCRKDLMVYLEASYKCIPVAETSSYNQRCNSAITISSSHGYISSTTSLGSNIGSPNCPWVITVNSGQNIKVVMYDFKTWTRQRAVGSTAGTTDQTVCPALAVFQDVQTTDMTYLRVCRNTRRKKTVFYSKLNKLKIYFVNVQGHADQINFLLEYEAVGCPDFDPMPNAYVRRIDNTAVVMCNATGERWHIVCRDTTWVGQVNNCSKLHLTSPAFRIISETENVKREKPKDKKTEFPLGLLVAIAIGVIVGIVLGFIFLLVVFICKNRIHRSPPRQTGVLLIEPYPDVDQQNVYKLMELSQPVEQCVRLQLHGLEQQDNVSNAERSTRIECKYTSTPSIDRGLDDDTVQATCDILNDIPCSADDWRPEDVYRTVQRPIVKPTGYETFGHRTVANSPAKERSPGTGSKTELTFYTT